MAIDKQRKEVLIQLKFKKEKKKEFSKMFAYNIFSSSMD